MPESDLVLTDAVADPSEYLPLETSAAGSMSNEAPMIASCSFDLVTALAAKGFVILTGPSGTGKSKVGLQLARALQIQEPMPANYELVPVGPDWNDSRRLLGFRSPFGKQRVIEGAPTNDTFDITLALRLLLRALHPGRNLSPHFLILDEMNLSHVERYFSSFLSVMEANRSVPPAAQIPLVSPQDSRLIAAMLSADEPGAIEAESCQAIANQNAGICFPANLFIVGTVNVDETTYMFSPKVLDRAHVLEMTAVSPRDYLSPGSTASAPASMPPADALALLKSGAEARRTANLENRSPLEFITEIGEQVGLTNAQISEIQEGVITALDGLYKFLEPVGFAFGYRTVNEVFAYLRFWLLAKWNISQGASAPAPSTAGVSPDSQGGTAVDPNSKMSPGAESSGLSVLGWKEGLDRALLQKVLPKLHGNRRELGSALPAVQIGRAHV